MYVVLSVVEYQMTRDIVLKNLKSGTIDLCFDDSMLTHYKEFGPMEKGQRYECKIELVGDVFPNKQEGAALCKIVDTNVYVGKKRMVKVLIGEDEYYLSFKELEEIAYDDQVYYECFRKDLIQVNDMIHGEFLD